MLKRLFDIVVSFTALVVLAVPLLVIALIVRLESKGPAIFKQRRAGKDEQPFTMLKFRSMRTDVDPYGSSPHSAEDPRMTKFGRFLRETSADELPQLLNVLIGTMSLVGPRPLYLRQAAEWDDRQKHRLDVLPGITGYAQAYGRGSLPIEDKIEMDLYYVENRTFWLDLKIIGRTVLNIFKHSGDTYEQRYSREKERETD
ncbi:MAG: sugar transferase [Phycisphaerae bacterium]